MHSFASRLNFTILVFLFLAACAAEQLPNGPAGSGGSLTTSSSSTSSSSNGSSSTSTSSSSSSSSSGEGGGPAASLSMLTLNLHCLRVDGTVYANNADRFAAIASLIAKRDVSAIALQEVCQRPGENAMDELRAAVEKSTQTTWSTAWTFAHIGWQGTPDQADEGVGLLVKGMLSNPTDMVLAVQGTLQRVASSATLPAEWSNMRLTSVHFEVVESSARTMQAREVAVAALVDTDPAFNAIIAGDFNDVEGSATHDAFPGLGYIVGDKGLDASGIDHVMVHRAAPLRPIAAEKVFLGAEAVSDHPGILVRFEPAPGDSVIPTRVMAQANPGAGHYLSFRGNLNPLTWDLGFPMRRMNNGDYAFISTEFSGDFECKVLLDDTTWQTGPNVQAKSGTNQLIMPAF